MLRLIEDWKKCLDKGEVVAMIAMDLSKAFDSLPHSLLIANLRAYGIDSQSCSLSNDYLHGRQQRVKLGDTFSTWQNIERRTTGKCVRPIIF